MKGGGTHVGEGEEGITLIRRQMSEKRDISERKWMGREESKKNMRIATWGGKKNGRLNKEAFCLQNQKGIKKKGGTLGVPREGI